MKIFFCYSIDMEIQKFSYDEFISHIPVSRETFTRLQDYVGLLGKWQKSINLVSKETLSDVWMRHIIDSAQLVDFIAPDEAIADVGTGAGLPGLVLAIMGVKNITLIESDTRKVAFLREAARITNANVSVLNNRVESIDIKEFSLITARAFASLGDFLKLIGRTLNIRHKLLILKGKKYDSEIQEVKNDWSFEYKVTPSITDKEGAILSMHHFIHKGTI